MPLTQTAVLHHYQREVLQMFCTLLTAHCHECGREFTLLSVEHAGDFSIEWPKDGTVHAHCHHCGHHGHYRPDEVHIQEAHADSADTLVDTAHGR